MVSTTRLISLLLLVAYLFVGSLGAASPFILCRDADGTSRVETVLTRCCGSIPTSTAHTAEPGGCDEQYPHLHGEAKSADGCVDTPIAIAADQDVSRTSSHSSDDDRCKAAATFLWWAGVGTPHAPISAVDTRGDSGGRASGTRIAIRTIVLLC